MVFSSFLIRAAVITTIMVLVSSCGPSDARPPWDTDQMLRELTSELRQFEGLTTDFDQSEVLAWRVDEMKRDIVSIPSLAPF